MKTLKIIAPTIIIDNEGYEPVRINNFSGTITGNDFNISGTQISESDMREMFIGQYYNCVSATDLNIVIDELKNLAEELQDRISMLEEQKLLQKELIKSQFEHIEHIDKSTAKNRKALRFYHKLRAYIDAYKAHDECIFSLLLRLSWPKQNVSYDTIRRQIEIINAACPDNIERAYLVTYLAGYLIDEPQPAQEYEAAK